MAYLWEAKNESTSNEKRRNTIEPSSATYSPRLNADPSQALQKDQNRSIWRSKTVLLRRGDPKGIKIRYVTIEDLTHRKKRNTIEGGERSRSLEITISGWGRYILLGEKKGSNGAKTGDSGKAWEGSREED